MVSHQEFADDCVVSPWADSLAVLLTRCKTLEEKALSLNQLSEFPEKIKQRGNRTRVYHGTFTLKWPLGATRESEHAEPCGCRSGMLSFSTPCQYTFLFMRCLEIHHASRWRVESASSKKKKVLVLWASRHVPIQHTGTLGKHTSANSHNCESLTWKLAVCCILC